MSRRSHRAALYAVVIGAFALALVAAVGSKARAQEAKSDKAEARDYGVTESDLRSGHREELGAFVYSQRCSVCHARTADGPTPYGPHLEGIMGRKAGETGWDKHTGALTDSEVVWDEAKLNELLQTPQAAVPGVNMDVIVRFKRSRTALIEYLKTL